MELDIDITQKPVLRMHKKLYYINAAFIYDVTTYDAFRSFPLVSKKAFIDRTSRIVKFFDSAQRCQSRRCNHKMSLILRALRKSKYI